MRRVSSHKYIGAKEDAGSSDIALLGCPLDATSSFRGGTKFAPESIRRGSWTLETYSPYQKHDLDEVRFYDAGDMELRPGDLPYSLELIDAEVTGLVEEGNKILVLGGEHLVTYPILKGIRRLIGNVQVVHFDAHCDLRDDYEGQRLSHATVMKRVKELGLYEMVHIGIRSGTRQEFEEVSLVDSPAALADRLSRSVPTYVSFDMDVFDPSLVSGVTTPEPGGLMFDEVMAFLSVLKGMNLIGADVVELSPDYDATFVSSICASKVVREILMLLHTKSMSP